MFIFQKNVLCLPQNLHDRIIMLRIMREGAACAVLDPSAIFLEIPGIPGAVLQAVHGAVAEQAVEIWNFPFATLTSVHNLQSLRIGANLRVKHRTSSRKSLCSE